MRFLYDPFIDPKKSCEGCSILDKKKPCHSVMDYEQEGFIPGDILFVSDSYRMEQGELTPFLWTEEALILEAFTKAGKEDLIPKVRFTSAVKCPSVKDADMTTDDRNICRQHIIETIKRHKPSIIFLCGNLPLKLLLKKSGVMDKRGTRFDFEGTPVIPMYHPGQVAIEPKNKYLFQLDIENGINQHYNPQEADRTFNFEVLDSIYSIQSTFHKIWSEHGVKWNEMSIDIETTGLNFLKDKIQTIAMSFDYKVIRNVVIPLYHKDFVVTEDYLRAVISSISNFSKMPVILHKANFDLKFLYKLGVEKFEHVYDSKILQHMQDENLPKSLDDLTKYYFASEREII